MSLTDKHCMNQTRRLRGPPHQRGSREAPDAMANHNTIHPASYTHLDIRCRMNGYSTEREMPLLLYLFNQQHAAGVIVVIRQFMRIGQVQTIGH